MSKQNKENTQSFMNNVTIILISQVLVKVLGMVYRIVITRLISQSYSDSSAI